MLEKIKNGYMELKEKVAYYVQKAEAELQGKSGEEKKEWVAKQIDSLIKLPTLWDDILNVDGLILGFLIDKIHFAFETVTDNKFGLAEPEDIAQICEAPAPAMLAAKAQMPLFGVLQDDVMTVDDRLDALYKEYGIKYEPVVPVKPDVTPPAVDGEVVVNVPVETVKPLPPTTAGDNFARSLAFVFGSEGGYNDHEADAGGPTNLGITSGTLASAVAQGITKENDIKKLTRTDAEKIYRKMYWERCAADKVVWHICYLLFDAAVNGGMGMAARTMQEAMNEVFKVGLVVDGKWGPNTQGAILKHWGLSSHVHYFQADVDKFSVAYLNSRKRYYDRILASKPGQKVFKNGWYNRLNNIAKHIGVAFKAA